MKNHQLALRIDFTHPCFCLNEEIWAPKIYQDFFSVPKSSPRIEQHLFVVDKHALIAAIHAILRVQEISAWELWLRESIRI